MEDRCIMKQRTLVTLLIIETVILAFVLLGKGTSGYENTQNAGDDSTNISWNVSGQTEIFREESPDGKYTLKIDEIGTPDFPFGNSYLEITLFEMPPEDERPGLYYCASFKADVANDGARGEYEIEWLNDGVQIILSGEEQPTAYYILPYKTLEEN